MSRSKECARCSQLEGELAQWKRDYKDLALAVAKREGYPTTPVPAVRGEAPVQFTVTPPLPAPVLAAIEDTTAAFSESRTMAIEAAKALLEEGVTPEQVEERLRLGDEIRV